MSLATLLVLADGRLPSGGHAHSGGLEAAVAAGRVRDVGDLEGFLRGRLATAGRVASAFAAAACARTGEWPALDVGLDTRTPSPALRAASRAQGRALVRAARRMWPPATPPPTPSAALKSAAPRDSPDWAASLGQPRASLESIGSAPHHPIALGAVAAAAGLGPLEAAVAAAHGTVTAPASAAVRLLGLDPYAVHALLAALAPECDRIAATSADRAFDPVDALPAAGAPLLDIGAEHHATWEVRLFAS